jgi:iron complex outermembrane receptor protein/hemoglobin/transferrin/lactoferrin receptor protein
VRGSSLLSLLLVLSGVAVAGDASAQRRVLARRDRAPRTAHEAEPGATVRGASSNGQHGARAGRASTQTTRRDMDERVVRSAPDALRYTAGVSVQQTAHSQASPYVRGVTGQQVLLMFDGVRLNNGLYRQGPNQYFFTVDAGSVDHIDVERGSSSVRYGSDAIGGVILAAPIEPRFDPSVRTFAMRARAFGTYTSADSAPGGRAEAEAQFGQRVALVGGAGYRVAGPLRGGGGNPRLNADGTRATGVDRCQGGVRSLGENSLARTPVLEDDCATQKGTGFRELTFDARLHVRINARLQAIAAVYGYRQFDAPRTDLCAPTWASDQACMRYEEQFRTLAYASLRGDIGEAIRDLSLTVSYQRAHERRRFDNPTGFSGQGWIDSVDTLGVSARAATPRFALSRHGVVGMTVRYGFDAWRDTVQSAEWMRFTRSGFVVDQPRGQYVDGSNYWYGGAFSDLEVTWRDQLFVRAGGRAAFAHATATEQASTNTAGINRGWGAFVARAGIEWKPQRSWSIAANIDQGFRPPNLDDLTSRQLTGPGFQIENPNLGPERSTTYELGTRLRSLPVDFDAWAFATRLDDVMIRAPRTLAECAAGSALCTASSTRIALVNIKDTAWILGAEASLRVRLLAKFEASATVSYAWGEALSPLEYGSPRLPLSRVPPLQGTVEARYSVNREVYVGAAFRWATDQTRLAYQDTLDPRIPAGGTPGYGVLDLRAGARVSRFLRVNAVLENVFDSAWRVHGSSVNGPGRGLMIQAAAGW